MVRRIVIHVMLLIGLSGPAGSNGFTGEDSKQFLDEADRHFKKVPPEINRYRGVTQYGETVGGSKPRQEDLDEEIRLFETAKAAGLLKEPPEQVHWLCHDLLVFAPKKGVQFLGELIDQITTPASVRYSSLFAAGKAGERIAVAKLQSPDVATRKWWSSYLRTSAILDESAEPIIQAIQRELIPR